MDPVERPLDRYLMRHDGYYNRIVPDWNLQFKTAQQSQLYGDPFAVYVREATDEGCIVQDRPLHTGQIVSLLPIKLTPPLENNCVAQTIPLGLSEHYE